MTNIAILGDGGWGTTLTVYLSKKGYKVSLWGAFRDYIEYLRKKRVNTKFLPGIKIPRDINLSYDLKDVVSHADLIILAIPSQFMRQVVRRLKVFDFSGKIILSVTKGIENKTLMRMSEVIIDELSKVNLAVLSGPTIAHEVAVDIPTTAVIASEDLKIAKLLQEIFISDTFRIYTNTDLIGVELGGSLKNVIAIACGISDGLGFGTNTKAALLSRGLAEITRLGLAMGANKMTFSGISGLGDLVTTCISPYSRNRFVGEEIGKGATLKEVLENMDMVAEGVPTAKSVYQLSHKYNVEMPIVKEVYLVLYRNKNPLQVVKDLMCRQKKQEFN